MSNKTNIPSLLDEPPIVLYPSLAKALGVNQAAVFQQLHYLLIATKIGKNKYNFVDNKWWVYNTYEEWMEYFTWLRPSTIKQCFLDLETLGIVVSQQGVKKPTDRRKWYTIDYEAWEKFRESIGQNLSDERTKSVPSMNGQNLSDVYSTEIENTTDIYSDTDVSDEISATQPTAERAKENQPQQDTLFALNSESEQPKKPREKKTSTTTTHPLRQRPPEGNPYWMSIVGFWMNKPFEQVTLADLAGTRFRFDNKRTGLFIEGCAFEMLYEELGGFSPEELQAALSTYRKEHRDLKPSQYPRETKIYEAIAPLIQTLVAKRRANNRRQAQYTETPQFEQNIYDVVDRHPVHRATEVEKIDF